jgi:hypothetical protein
MSANRLSFGDWHIVTSGLSTEVIRLIDNGGRDVVVREVSILGGWEVADGVSREGLLMARGGSRASVCFGREYRTFTRGRGIPWGAPLRKLNPSPSQPAVHYFG